MSPRRFPPVIALMTLLCLGCDDAVRTTAPELQQQAVRAQRLVKMMDACDPTSFNAAIGAGTCVRNGGVTFAKFLQLLGKHQKVGAWHFAPSVLNVRVGQELLAVNRGGEEHTFTEVEEFGGGIVPELNQLSGQTTVAPECEELDADDFVPPGGTFADEVEHTGTERYQCCIHPWMRLTVQVKH